MALRLIEMVLQDKDGIDLLDLLKDHPVIEHRQIHLVGGELLVRIVLDAEHSEAVLDLLDKEFSSLVGTRVVMLPVEATLPRAGPEPEPVAEPGEGVTEDKAPSRIGREELYEDIKDAARCTKPYLTMVALSTVVASIGLQENNITIVIGAMVIAPLLGPNVAIALGTTLGDLPLLRRALVTVVAGVAVAAVLSLAMGVLMDIDATVSEVVSRTRVGMGGVALALASGAAGTLAFTTGAPATLIGVMVAVALLPPLATFGLLLGGGHPALAMGALSLFAVNLICVNLAGVMTFVVQGIHPVFRWEKHRAAKATRTAIGVWAALLAALIGVILLLRAK
jgi:uncharacterized hydrophobic protein (TIGR00341 family)